MLEVLRPPQEASTLYRVSLVILSLSIAHFLSQAVYNAVFHPLSKYPGPFLHKISRIPYFYRHINGTLPLDMLDLHRKYGDIVRIAPDELAFSHPDAWKDIMGHQKSGRELSKAMWFYQLVETMPKHIVNEPCEAHGRIRRQLSHGFSDRGMREQEPFIKQYVDLLIRQLRGLSDKGETRSSFPIGTTIALSISLAILLSASFGCLEGSTYHAWIAGTFQAGRLGTILQVLSFAPSVKRLLLGLAPKSAREAEAKHKKLTRVKLIKRIERGGDRPDLIEGLIKKRDELAKGSETTANLLSGATYYILRDPNVLDKLVKEVRTTFKSEDDINLVSVGKLTYMLAVLNEALRMYPPVANGLPRQVPEEGSQVLDQFIPANTYVAIHQWALYRREEYFHHAEEFRPERFLDDPEFANDRRDTLQPFHVGPRNCLGRNLAYSEMRLILARNLQLRYAPG